MPVFTDLEERVKAAPFDGDAHNRRLPGSTAVAQSVHLVHVSGKGVSFDVLAERPPHELPTSKDTDYYTDDTRKAEDLLGLARSAYFYAGRAHPEFGNVAMAFTPDCEANHTGSATPFDTGGLLHPNRYIKVRLTPNDGEAERVSYGKASEIPLDKWREVFGRVLAAYFEEDEDYWRGRPNPWDPEGLYELNDSWRAWSFEVRFYESQSIHERVAWCADESVMNMLRRMEDEQDPTPPGDPLTALDRFLDGPAAVEPAGTPNFCDRMEQWIRRQVEL